LNISLDAYYRVVGKKREKEKQKKIYKERLEIGQSEKKPK
jgi:hypothetical protein